MSHGIAILIFRINNQHHAKQHQQHQHPPPISHIRMDVTWKYKLACAKSRGSAQCSPEILAEHHKPTPQPMHKTQNNKRNTTQKVHSHGRPPPPIPPPPYPCMEVKHKWQPNAKSRDQHSGARKFEEKQRKPMRNAKRIGKHRKKRCEMDS